MMKDTTAAAGSDGAQTWASAFAHETARLSLFACDMQAAQELALIVHDPRVFVPYYMEPMSHQGEAAEVWQQSADGWRNAACFNLAVRMRQSGQIVGGMQFTATHFSYFVQPDHWQQGIGREMVQVACRYLPALLGIRRLRAKVLRDNQASCRILEGAGFAFAGMSHEAWGSGAGQVAVLHYVRNCI